jgi:hypothetical protein
MPTKKDLAALLNDTQPPPLRRGRGLRLSQASKQARELLAKTSAPPEAASQPDTSAPIDPPLAGYADEAIIAAEPLGAPDAAVEAALPVELAAPADPAPPASERDKRKLQLRKDLLKQCKRLARAQDRKLYQVIESAIEEYIQRHGAHE